ncbi:17-beta-hydroxysteroid dehydrogenase type 1-like [Xenia sp. Carnegie-2017]|uniref:17-beta-hydroxysteroid dehydrogenase type 1-like n=1 Tax=Xenia sp. Carnegie-2017 TaxID=2897299 RepID=UPI001F03E8CE|nr:17-beta-hydroxysteroid dehydrogenase type 1-like [Xenia sp. Carnegie-2017]
MAEEIVLITGTSAGLGLSTVYVLAKQTDKKFKVYASMRKSSKRDELLEKTAGCRNVVVIEMDVCSEDSVNAAVKEILEKEGRIDVVVNNAAIGWCGVLEVQPWESITSIYETNVYGVLRVIRSVVPSMKKNKKGRIINISSIAGIHCSPFFTVYGSSKYALEGITDSLAPELASFNVHIVTIQPGAIKTRALTQFAFNSGQLPDDDTSKLLGEKYVQTFAAEAINQAQTPEEVAEYILKAITDEKPQPRYLTSKGFEEFAKSKFCDPTGRIPFEMSKTFLQ